jgi:hypothetical protein
MLRQLLRAALQHRTCVLQQNQAEMQQSQRN